MRGQFCWVYRDVHELKARAKELKSSKKVAMGSMGGFHGDAPYLCQSRTVMADADVLQ